MATIKTRVSNEYYELLFVVFVLLLAVTMTWQRFRNNHENQIDEL